MKRNKILIACDSSRSLLDFRGRLMEELLVNHNVCVFTPKIHQIHVRKKLERLGISIYENDLNGSTISIFSDLAYIIKLFKLMRSLKPDVFFPYTFKPVIYGTLVANFCHVNRITPMLTGLGYSFLNTNSKKQVIKLITRTLLKISLKANKRTSLILQNKDDYNTLIRAGIINTNQAAHIVNGSGVDLSHYDYSEPEPGSLNFLMISRLINAKGVNEYYEAAKIILQKHPNVRFTLIGAYDPNVDAIDAALYNKIKAGNVIEYKGEVDDVRSFIKACSVVVLPSYYGEGVPRCILEGMAMGRAIITSDSVGCRETINLSSDQPSGFLVPIKNATCLAEKMLYFILNPLHIVSYGKNGRAYAFEKFDVRKVNLQMLQILEGPTVFA
ncbi:glycosyltransferase family 4 protein [Arcticibacter eurypsychrophilus]|uniref:glycosyltransferase family 4 protein n=1 Tax=Arcticibacter eurypsychrophilus TaxID=1434752 RepID=UPI00084D4CBB|nr:glycosyltransferase family 4 protein [Arcticibacter eurypsychrophilus]